MIFHYTDGGRAAAGYKGEAMDCVARAIAVVTNMPYQQVYRGLSQWPRRRTRGNWKSPRTGVHTKTKWFKDYMASLGFKWVPTMGIGTGARVHLRADELPKGRLVVAVSKHYTAVINGELWDNHDCSRNETRCVYGYWTQDNSVPINMRTPAPKPRTPPPQNRQRPGSHAGCVHPFVCFED